MASTCDSDPLDLQEARALFMPWKHGFNIHALKGGKIFRSLSGLPSKSIPYLGKMGAQVGLPTDNNDSMTSRFKKFEGVPSTCVPIASLEKLPKVLRIRGG